MKFILGLFIVFSLVSFSYGEDNNQTKIDKKIDISQNIDKLNTKLKMIDAELLDNIWTTRYNNYLTYRNIEKELSQIKKDAKKYSRWKGEKYKELSYQLFNKIKIKENELELISEYKDSPIGKQITPATIPKAPIITNPIMIIEGYSFIKVINDNIKNYKNINAELTDLLSKLKTKIDILEELYSISKDEKIKKSLNNMKTEFKDFVMVVDIVSTTDEVYTKKIAQIIQEVKHNIKEEVTRSIKIVAIIITLLIISFIIKLLMKKYIKDDDRHYTMHKFINFIFIIIIGFIILFSYIENVSYLVTILGFASAGIAIALKDWFMSLFGWMTIVLSGSISVGDRIKVSRNGIDIVGDVLDVSLLRIAIREDVTFTSYTLNRRAGRVFFVPNNYIFTDLIANYTFDELRTVWDGIDLNITFESNHKKAVEIAREIVTRHARGYTDLTKKRLQKIRKKYILRSANPEPRIFTFVESYGIVISSWYYTNSHATLALRSVITVEIFEAFKKEDDITLAYPTQTLNINNNQLSTEELNNKINNREII
ncbi:MAG: mechanosensitive ion channel [Campylobacterota bacterium]|nr:mechanosensitive ion channel [Campylobacterota bacterium]